MNNLGGKLEYRIELNKDGNYRVKVKLQLLNKWLSVCAIDDWNIIEQYCEGIGLNNPKKLLVIEK